MRAFGLASVSVFAVCLMAYAQNSQPESAGGNWTHNKHVDKLTDKETDFFTIAASEEVGSGLLKGKPTFSLVCDHGKLRAAAFSVPLVVESNSPFFLRTDTKIRQLFGVTVGSDFRTILVPNWAAKAFVDAVDARFQFTAFQSSAWAAKFSPAGLDRTKLAGACGGKAFR